MQLSMTQNNTWIFSGFEEILMIAFTENNDAHILKEGILEIDHLDGSFYDSDGDEKKLLIKFENNAIYFETFPEDYDFWKGTENCDKQGCLGYVAHFLNELKTDTNFEYNILPNNDSDYEEAFLWHLDYVKENHSEVLSTIKKIKPV